MAGEAFVFLLFALWEYFGSLGVHLGNSWIHNERTLGALGYSGAAEVFLVSAGSTLGSLGSSLIPF